MLRAMQPVFPPSIDYASAIFAAGSWGNQGGDACPRRIRNPGVWGLAARAQYSRRWHAYCSHARCKSQTMGSRALYDGDIRVHDKRKRFICWLLVLYLMFLCL